MNTSIPPACDARDLVKAALALDPRLSASDPAEFIRRRHDLLETLMAQAGAHRAQLHQLQEQIDHSGAVNPSPQQAVEGLLLALQDRLRLLNQLFAELDSLAQAVATEHQPPPGEH
ncbi:DUF3135 domain-containing protein [Dechloromonas sp. ZY10]|uniref:DUF3135 domain-containing protein n=1 Tax=Dechloromonas aquae TaxID=2664436 RepID=UPI00352791A7